VTETGDKTRGSHGQGVGIGPGVVGQGVELHVAPDGLDRIELRGVCRQVFDAQSRMTLMEVFFRRCFVHVKVVPNGDHVPAKMTEQIAAEEDHPFDLDVEVRGQGKAKSDPGTNPARDVAQLTPQLCNSTFAENPLGSDIDQT
jgi:hypothetical protein